MGGGKRETVPAEVPDDLWGVAREREQVIRPLVSERVRFGVRTELMRSAAAALGITLKHLYTLVQAYAADPRTRSLVPNKGGRATGTKLLDPRVETIIEEEIQTEYLSRLKPTKSR